MLISVRQPVHNGALETPTLSVGVSAELESL